MQYISLTIYKIQALLKGYFTQKLKFYRRLLTLKLFQTSMCSFVLLNTKKDI